MSTHAIVPETQRTPSVPAQGKVRPSVVRSILRFLRAQSSMAGVDCWLPRLSRSSRYASTASYCGSFAGSRPRAFVRGDEGSSHGSF